MNEENVKVIKQTIEEFLGKIGFETEVEIKNEAQEDKENIVCDIKTKEDSNLLIGQYGVNLQAVQHLLRLIIRKKLPDERAHFIIDVNSYRQQKNQSIIEQAQEAAQQAITEGRVIIMRPMTAYERRIVHMELSKNEKVVTESIGEADGRKVVVKPAKTI
jgi:spoIIIJ-associated protein